MPRQALPLTLIPWRAPHQAKLVPMYEIYRVWARTASLGASLGDRKFWRLFSTRKRTNSAANARAGTSGSMAVEDLKPIARGERADQDGRPQQDSNLRTRL